MYVLSFSITTRSKFGNLNKRVRYHVTCQSVTYIDKGVTCTCTFEFRPLSFVDKSGRVAVKNVGSVFNKHLHF